MNGGEEPEPPTPVYWKTVTGVSPLSLVNALARDIQPLTQYGKVEVIGAPTLPVVPYIPADATPEEKNARALQFDVFFRVAAKCYSTRATGDPIYAFALGIYGSVGYCLSKNLLRTDVRCYSDNYDYEIQGYPTSITIDGETWQYALIDDYTNNEAADYLPVYSTVEDAIRALATPLDPSPEHPAQLVCNNGALRYSANMANVNADTALVGYYISAQGVVSESEYNWMYQDYIPVKPSTVYTLSMSTPVYFISISEYSTAEDSGFVARKTGSSGSNASLTITTEANTNFIRFGSNMYQNIAITLEEVLAINWMLNPGGTAMDYRPYVEGGIYADGTPETLTISADGAETQTVTNLPSLLSVGDYADEVEIISGAVTHKVGIKVLDGTEPWDTLSLSRGYYLRFDNLFGAPDNVGGYCTHFQYDVWSDQASPMPTNRFGFNKNSGVDYVNGNVTLHPDMTVYDTVDKFKAFLAAQYAAGTPVIVVYPLAEETTEHGAAHSLHTTEGDNVVSVTSNVDPVNLTAVYASSEE